MKVKSLAPSIRACIRAAGKPLTIREIAEGIGADITRVRDSCFNMARAGVLEKSGALHHAQRFAIGRPVSLPGRRITRGSVAAMAKREAAETAKQARRAEKARQIAERLATQALREQRAAKRKQVELAVLAQSAKQRSAKEPAKVVPPTAAVETVEQWMARTGKRPEKLCQHATAQPFRSIGIRAMDYAALDRRKAA